MYEGIDSPHKRQYVRYGVVALLALVLLGFWLWHARLNVSDSRLSVAQNSSTTPSNAISFEVVTSDKDQEKGLGGRSNIPPDYGMLFVFDKDGNYPFWMKGMLVPIDIIWLSDNGTIVYLEESVSPSTYPNALDPKVSARYVLEMRAGQAQARGWKVGSHVTLPLPYGKSMTK